MYAREKPLGAGKSGPANVGSSSVAWAMKLDAGAGEQVRHGQWGLSSPLSVEKSCVYVLLYRLSPRSCRLPAVAVDGGGKVKFNPIPMFAAF